jgi:MFS family permease
MSSDVIQPPQLSNGRLALLGIASVVLCVSFIMSIFAPFPLALAFILYGRVKGILTGLFGLLASFIFSYLVYQDFTLFGFYICVFIFGFSIAEITARGISPVKGIVAIGMSFLILLSGAFFVVLKQEKITVEQFIVKQLEQSSEKIAEQKELIEKSSEKDSIQVLQLLENPQLLAKELKEVIPSFMFIGVFLMLWFNMFLTLKSRRMLLTGHDFSYSEKNLLKFKVPFPFVFVLVLGLVLAIWGNEFGKYQLESLGFTIIKCLGVFYFFQGFGVFTDLLNFLGIFGFFRTLLVMIVIFMANYLIAIVGLLDNWFEFRKYFKKLKTDD